ncbi:MULTISPECIES: MFS transporter [unclassified Spongiibacter]|jgi:predicted MFS family arabinose efflux permease|uniref:spinster family MFS transporter n=2 Tax=Spongiibacteraceae TaxID=1706375 RepID=UPI000C0B7DE6|nr:MULTISPECIES: MFS transporter [unclassified Spongiibacter]MAK43215.1 MFS transporter [Spongiibacter sp.]MEE2653737.1 MFS transporter [Pseudomonadota bacterium]|tara:strand:- start:2914 stop:4191 length:1278 start_codon:yes stop_codon:yes gene_type:complete
MNSQHYRSDGRAYYALFILTIVYSFNFIDRQLLAILQESIKAELLLSDTQLGLLTGFAFALFYVTAGIPIARWADAGNRRNIVALAVFIWSFMTAISGLVQNYLQLLLARIGVGVGEAGGSPPSHSMISDMFPAERRASALGFYSTGVSIGILFGFLMGGWLNEFFGWRVAFFVVGVPGVLLALVVRYTLREPRRGLSENRDDNPEPVAVKEVVALLWSRRSFRHMAWAGALSAFAGYSVANWSASFIIRSYGMSTGELGTWLALIIGIGGAVGVFGGGLLADKLAAKDTRWYVLLPALAGVISLPFAAGVYLVDNVYASLLLMIIPAIQSNVFLGNTLAVSHSLVGLRMRAMASAILFFIFNLVGLGAGPWSVGLLSDLLAPQFGDESLRYAMLALVPLMVSLSALHFYLSSRHLKRDLAAAPP